MIASGQVARRVIAALNTAQIAHVLVGAFARNYYAEPRSTKDEMSSPCKVTHWTGITFTTGRIFTAVARNWTVCAPAFRHDVNKDCDGNEFERTHF
jgi:hypothetical protein